MGEITRMSARAQPGVHCDEWFGAPGSLRGTIAEIRADGTVCVVASDGCSIECDVLEGLLAAEPPLCSGDELLVVVPDRAGRGVALGRIRRYTPLAGEDAKVIEAARALTLRCGESSIDLRADGKVVIRGDDVLVRAKGSQRIRAGTVSIN